MQNEHQTSGSDVFAFLKTATEVKSKTQVKGASSFFANSPYQKYQLDLMFNMGLTDEEYEMAMLCMDAFTKYCARVRIKSNNSCELALGFIKCMRKMGKPLKVVYSNGETDIRNSV